MDPFNLPQVTRRVFLNRTLQALGAVATLPLAATCIREARASAPSPDIPPLLFLNDREYATLVALGDALIPPGGAFEIGARDVGLARRIDSYLPRMDPEVATGFRGALAWIETEGPGMAGKDAPFSALGGDDRAAVLDGMLRSDGLARGVFVATKYVCLVHFYTVDETWKFTGYDGPMLLEGAK